MEKVRLSRFGVEDLYVTEKERNNFDYLREVMDYHISRLVYDKTNVQKARNLYEKRRDAEEYKYLEEVFGLESPMSIKMSSIISNRIDILVGMFLEKYEDEDLFRVSFSDSTTTDSIGQEKNKAKSLNFRKLFKEQMQINEKNLQEGKELSAEGVNTKSIQKANKIIDDNFVSKFEIAAQHLLNFARKDATFDLKGKLRQMAEDLFVTGETYYRQHIRQIGSDPVLDVCKPENSFFNKNTNYVTLKTGSKSNIHAFVHRTYMTRSEIISTYGEHIGQEEAAFLFGSDQLFGGQRLIMNPRDLERTFRNNEDINKGSLHHQHTFSSWDTLPVYHVEWLVNNLVELDPEEREDLENVVPLDRKENSLSWYTNTSIDYGSGKPKKYGYRVDRYEGIRIGYALYLNVGKSKHIVRSEDKPYMATLTYNGVAYGDRNGTPQSVALNLKNLQDSYDIMTFFRDNLIAYSGIDGSRINLAAIPAMLGNSPMERLIKFLQLRKQGVEVIDSSEDGAALFNHYGDFKGGANPQMITSINEVLKLIEEQADSVSGVNRFMYSKVEERDAATNVKQGITQGFVLTKNLMEHADMCARAMLEDFLNLGKITYKKGKKGSYLLGEQIHDFNVLPEYITNSDFNVHVTSSNIDKIKVDRVNSLAIELAGKNSIGDDILLELAMQNSTTKMVKLLRASLAEKKEENNAIKQLQKAVEDLSAQLKQIDAERQRLENENKQLVGQVSEIEWAKVNNETKRIDGEISARNQEIEISRFDVAGENLERKQLIALEARQLELTGVQGNAVEVKNDV